MKILSLNDVHFGVMNDDKVARAAAASFSEWLAMECDVDDPDIILFNGDTFDNRKHVSLLAMETARSFIGRLRKRWPNAKVIASVGNHDIYYKTTTETHSLFAADVDEIISSPKMLSKDVLVLPWICDNTVDKTMAALDKLKKRGFSGVIFSHASIIGSSINGTIKLPDGFQTDIFPCGATVINGHIHYPSKVANVINVGLNYDFSLPFAGVEKRFAFVDGTELTLITNPIKTFVPRDEYDGSDDKVVIVSDGEDMSDLVSDGVNVVVKPVKTVNEDRSGLAMDIPDDISAMIENYIDECVDKEISVAVKKVVKQLMEDAA